MSHNAKYFIKSLKRVISGLGKKKEYSEENIVSIHGQILQLSEAATRAAL